MRLASLVVFSAAICYGIASPEIDWWEMGKLVLGGFLITGASNGFNQIIEKDLDRLMSRTQDRPMPQGRMKEPEALLLSSVLGIAGVAILYSINPLSAALGLVAMVLYSVIYTPLKKETPFAVFVGAIPGSIPPMLGYIAYSGEMSIQAAILFGIQFMWQFPHFWAIAWRLDSDYKKAGFKLLPSPNGKDAASTFQTLIYTIGLVPVSLLPVVFKMSGLISGAIILLAGCAFVYQAYQLYKSQNDEDAKRLMFGSFFYLPIVQLAILLDKL